MFLKYSVTYPIRFLLVLCYDYTPLKGHEKILLVGDFFELFLYDKRFLSLLNLLLTFNFDGGN